MIGRSASFWLLHRLGFRRAATQLTEAEQRCLTRYATGRRSLLEIGVMHGVSTALMRGVMDHEGTLTAIDPHPPGRLGVSFERWIAQREIARNPGGKVDLLRTWSHSAAKTWTATLDFLFVDGDHSWEGIERDWQGFSRFLIPRGVAILHDSRSVPTRPDLDSVRYTETVVRGDPRFQVVDEVDSMTVLERRP
jgi:predicted O-methyltransferase YrrM